MPESSRSGENLLDGKVGSFHTQSRLPNLIERSRSAADADALPLPHLHLHRTKTVIRLKPPQKGSRS
jgi:hypothetical protein